MDSRPPVDKNRTWYIVQRWQEYEGEGRANLLRIVGIGSFYIIHLLQHFQLLSIHDGGGQDDRNFHVSITALAVAWTMVALGVLVCLRHRIFPHWLTYVSTSADIILLTSILCVADGPRSPLVVGYFLLLALAALRLSLPLVRFATVGTMVGYVCVLGGAKWPGLIGKSDADLTVPRYEQLIVLVALGLSGVLLGQVLRRTRRMADEYADRLSSTKESAR